MAEGKTEAAGVRSAQAAGTTTATELTTDQVQPLRDAIGYIKDFRQSGTTPPGGWDAKVIEPLEHLYGVLLPMVNTQQQTGFGQSSSGR